MFCIKKLTIHFIRFLFRCLAVLPIKENYLLFSSFNGDQYSDSPKSIYEYMLSLKLNCKYIWVFKNLNKIKVFPKNDNTIIIRKNTLKYYYYWLISKFIIINNFENIYLPIRKDQIVINTWHGGGAYKKVGLSSALSTDYDNFFFDLQNKNNTCFIASSSFIEYSLFRNSFNFKGEILRFGMPRNAVLFKKDNTITDKVREYYNLKPQQKIVLFAPTFRNNRCLKKCYDCLDTERCLKALSKKFGYDFVLIMRTHRLDKTAFNYDGHILNGCDYPDIQDLLIACDILISDYSSLMWDFSLMKKPVFVYAPDANEYKENTGFFVDIHKWPHIICFTNDELELKILNFDYKKYRDGIEKYLLEMGSYESEKSTKHIIDWITERGNIR